MDGPPGAKAEAGENLHLMKLFSVAYKWDDKNGIDSHVTQGIVLPSGIDVKEEGTIEGRVEPNKLETAIVVDMSGSLMYDVEGYSGEFYEYTAAVYNDNHDKIKAWNAAIAEAKGSSASNKIKFLHREPTCGVKVEKDPFEGEGGKGLRAFTVGKRSNPESMAHVELIGERPFHEVVGDSEAMPQKMF